MDEQLKTGLRNALKAPKDKPHYFALVAKAGDGALMVDKRKIAPKLIAAAQKSVGSSTIVRGVCFGEEGAMIFETVRSPGNVAPVVKKIMKAQTGLTLNLEFRLGARADDGGEDDEADAEEAPETGSASSPKPGGSAAKAGPGDAKTAAAKAAYDELLGRVMQKVKAARDAHSAAVAKAGPRHLQAAADKAKAGVSLSAIQELQLLQKVLEVEAADQAEAREEWKTTRANAITLLKSTASKIAAAKHPSSGKAILEIQSVIKNLTAEPATGQQIEELQRWLDNDEVVADVCDLVEDIRPMLDQALAKLRVGLA